MKSILGFIFSIFIAGAAYTQTNDWVLYTSVDGVEIYTTESDCHAKNIPDQKAIIIKVVNTTDKDLQVEWDKAIWYNGQLVTHDVSDDEHHYTVGVKKKSMQEGSCETPHGALYIFKDFITYDGKSKLTKFELQNIKVSRLK